MNTRLARYRRIAQATSIACAAMITSMAHADPLPSQLVPTDNAQPVEITEASGVQIYSCEYGDGHRLGWVFKSPSATLYDASGHASIHHFAGPSWQAEDGSRIVGHVLAQAPSKAQQSIPQLLLQVTPGSTGKGMLSDIRYVQRIDTVGGIAPAQGCTTEHQTGNSPYWARYVFLK